jgi:pimeloyl-ACP methyl ester carboxylesterase
VADAELPTLLLLHDGDDGPAQWREFVPLFESRFRVLTPEVRGEEDPAAEAARLRAAAGAERFGVIGQGAGGAVAQELARGGGVEALVLLGAPKVAPDDDLAAFDFPVLLLWGEDDDVVPVAVAESLNDAIPTSTLGLLPGVGHDLVAEAAPTIAPMIYEYLRVRYLRASHEHAHEGIVRIQLERRPPWVDLEEDERDDWFDVPEDEAAP